MIKPLSLLVVLVLAAYVHSQAGPPFIIIQGVLRDQAPAEMKDCEAVGTNNNRGRAGTANGTFGFVGTDFQLPSGYYRDNEKGLVGAECNKDNEWGAKTPCGRIGLDRTPVYAHSGQSPWKNVRSPATFNRWFHDSEQTKNLVYSITLAKNQGSSSALYSYRNNSQFPLDGQGWGDFCADAGNPKRNHNYGYCWETHFRFGYQGGERFTFTGDDDVWVYINNMLVIDLGSLHTSMTSSVYVDDIPGLKKGESYRFDFFYCERHTTESNMQITTSLAAYCAYTDWCGVCEGNGQSCCTDEIVDKYCNDGDLCTIESCGVVVPPNTTNCNRERVQCDESNICKPTSCNPKTGKCETKDANCDDNNLCTEDVCVNPVGCRYTLKTCNDNNLCTVDKCDAATGKCVFDPLICDDGDACTTSTCNPATGCVHQRLTCPNDRCTSTTCNRITGCANTTISCNDYNACTIDSCDPATGCKREILNCDDGDACTSDKCDTQKGCVFTPIVCNDNSNCTTDSCSKTRGCDFKPVECAAQKCKNVKCDINLGCVYTDKNCNDNNACTDDSCDLNSDQCRNIQKVCDDKSQCTTDACVAGTCRFTPVVCTDNDMCTNNFCTNSTGCGTSVVDCNDNNACTTDSCSPATGCGYKDVSCDDQDACTVDSCDSKTGCKNEKLDCDDGNECTIDSCSKTLGCQYAPRVCNDGSRCTTDSCNNKTGCVFSQITCNDNSRCTTDTCAPATGCVFTNITCNDNLACTIDSCSPTIGCTAVNKNCASGDDCIIGSCDTTSGLCKNSSIPDCTKCTNRPSCSLETTDKCQPKICDPNTGDCINGARVNCDDRSNCTVDSCLDGKCSNTPVTCDDNNPCTIDSCDKVNGCIFTPIVCNDFSVCTNDSCVNGECVFTRIVCNDNKACTIDTCNATTGCVFTDVQCGDNNKCTNEVCNTSTGKCEYPAVVCNDDKACTVDTCNPATGCVFTDKVCNDNSLCTTDSCPPATGVCAFDPINCTATLSATKCDIVSCTATKGCSKVPMVCDDNNPCTSDSCSEITGACVFTPIAEFCLPCAGTPCTWSDSCNPKICDNTTNTCKESPVVCNDNTACTTDKCDNSGPEAKCVFTDISCPTLDFCKPVSCDRVAGCVTTDVVCDDNNLCTDDSCVSNDSNYTCIFTPKACSGADLCNPTVCNLTTGSCDVHPIVCDDQNLCTDDSCDLTSGQCSFVLRECTKDTCNPQECERESGLCVPTPVVCNDGNPCTIDSVVCSANTSFLPECLFVTNVTICDDGDPCTDDFCDSTVLPGENPCKNTTTICPRVSPCYIDLGCVPDVGCSKLERDCLSNATETLNKCTIYKCDPSAGCIYEPKICENRDINCFVNECNNATGNCEESKAENFNSAKAKTGVICPLVYDSKVKTAALAGGIVAGIVLGALAAAAIIGFGGKAGYDFLMAKNSPMGPVASNPLYTQAAGAGNNPLYGGSP